MIAFDGAGLSLNRTVVLDDISFRVRRGEFVYLTGPSGAGKSSILKLIHLDLLPTAGAVSIQGTDTRRIARSRYPYLRRTIGCIFQDYKLLPDRTALENVSFALEVTGAKRGTMRQKALQTLYTVGMGHRVTHYPHELSGGECQRVAIARALVQEPVLLLADEPTGNLDNANAAAIMDLLASVNRCGTAVIMATHKPEFVTRRGVRVIQIANGRMVS